MNNPQPSPDTHTSSGHPSRLICQDCEYVATDDEDLIEHRCCAQHQLDRPKQPLDTHTTSERIEEVLRGIAQGIASAWDNNKPSFDMLPAKIQLQKLLDEASIKARLDEYRKSRDYFITPEAIAYSTNRMVKLEQQLQQLEGKE